MQTKRILGLAVFLAILLVIMAVWLRASYIPLGKDERLIAHFNAHRADIEELVKRYREYVPSKDMDHGTNWNRSQEVQEIMKRAGVERIDCAGSIWMSNPYSVETARKVDRLYRHPEEGGFRSGFDMAIRYSNIQIILAPSSDYEGVMFFSRVWIWKEIFFFPEIPRVEKGRLWKPPGVDGIVKESYRVFDSLNQFPSNWKRGECVMRRIDDHWFINMCRG